MPDRCLQRSLTSLKPHNLRNLPRNYKTLVPLFSLSLKAHLIFFHCVPLATLRFEILRHQKRMTLQIFLRNKQRDVRCHMLMTEHGVAYFGKDLRSHPFLMISRNFKIQATGLPMVRSQTD